MAEGVVVTPLYRRNEDNPHPSGYRRSSDSPNCYGFIEPEARRIERRTPPMLKRVAHTLPDGRVLVTWHSSYTPHCGNLEYGMQLERAMGIQPLAKVPSKVHLHLIHYGGELHPMDLRDMILARKRGEKVVVVCHAFLVGSALKRFPDHIPTLSLPADAFAVHRDYAEENVHDPRVHVVYLGCPVWGAPNREFTQTALRERFSLPQDAVIVGMNGFLLRDKQLGDVVDAVVAALPSNALLQLCISRSSAVPQTDIDDQIQKLEQAVKRHGDRVIWIRDWLPEEEMLSRLRACDFGARYRIDDTWGVSSAAHQWVSVRLPLALSASNHMGDLQGGVLRSASNNVKDFAATVARLASDEKLRWHLSAEMEVEYQRLNMNVVAQRYLKLFESLRA